MTHTPEVNLMFKFLKSLILEIFNNAFTLCPFEDLALAYVT